MAAAKLIRHKVFVSYSHKDEAMLQRLQVHLKPLERNGILERWDDTKIRPGQRWRQEIRQGMDSAKIAVLLVSPDFMASDFIAKDELPPLLLAAEQDGLTILCVNLSHYYEHGETLSQFQQLNRPSQPLEGMTKVEQDAVWAKLAKEIAATLNAKPAAASDDAARGMKSPANEEPQSTDDKPAAEPQQSLLSTETRKLLSSSPFFKEWIKKQTPADKLRSSRWDNVLKETTADTEKPPSILGTQFNPAWASLLKPTATLAFTFHSLPDAVRSVAFSPDGRTIATACWNHIHLWDTATRRWLAVLEGQRVMHDRSRWRYYVSGGVMAFAPGSKVMATSGTDAWASETSDIVLLWNLQSHEVYGCLAGHGKPITSLAFSPDGQRLASGSEDATAKIWDLNLLRVEHDLWGHGNDVECVAYSSAGNLLATGSKDESIKLWSPFTGQEKRTLSGLGYGPSRLAFVPGTPLLAATVLGKLRTWNTDTGREEGSVDEGLFALAFSPDGTLAAVDASEGDVAIYRRTDHQLLQRFKAHDERTQCLAFSPDGKWLLSGGVDRTAKLWQIQPA